MSWTNPTAASFTGVMIRRLQGPVLPTSTTAGTLVVDAARPATSYTNTRLTAGTQYSYALFAHNATPAYTNAATVASTTLVSGKAAWTLGYNAHGQLGDSTITNRLTPGQVGTDTHWALVAAGHNHTVALRW